MLKRVQESVAKLPGGAGSATRPADRLLDAACENARTLSKLCDVLEAGPARARAGPSRELLEVPDGAFILPEEL